MNEIRSASVTVCLCATTQLSQFTFRRRRQPYLSSEESSAWSRRSHFSRCAHLPTPVPLEHARPSLRERRLQAISASIERNMRDNDRRRRASLLLPPHTAARRDARWDRRRRGRRRLSDPSRRARPSGPTTTTSPGTRAIAHRARDPSPSGTSPTRPDRPGVRTRGVANERGRRHLRKGTRATRRRPAEGSPAQADEVRDKFRRRTRTWT